MNNNTTTYYFLGIGGIGMSALARYFNFKGFRVLGYDRTCTPLTQQLENEGIAIHYSAHSLPIDCSATPENTVVVYTPAVPNDFEEFQYFANNGFTMLKRAQVLGKITRNSKGICIAGTHGKTTTSTMTAHLLHSSSVDCSAFLGGVSKNYDTNLLISNNDYVVIEADEYDRSFHQLTPHMALITAADADHLDIYGTKEEFCRSFEKFMSLVQENGYLIVKEGLNLELPQNSKKQVSIYSYGMNSGDFRAENIVIENGEITFDFVTPEETISNIQLGVPVLINVENAVGAMALAYLVGVKPEELRTAMANFKGIKRRFDIQVKSNEIVYIDDYAHHPEELKASISSIKKLYPNRKVCGIFQPHLYSRTRDFAKEFGESLSLLNELILLEIYAARELPIEGITANVIFENVTIEQKLLTKKDSVLSIIDEKLQNNEIDILLTFGAGNIDQLIQPITDLITKKLNA